MVKGESETDKIGDVVDASDRSGRLSSVVFPDDCEVLDEMDDLYPYSADDADLSFSMSPRPRRSTRISLQIDNDDVMPPVDWSSLLKSCKLAKNCIRDSYSEQIVVTNMFMSNLAPLKAALNLYSMRCCDQINSSEILHSLDGVKACATEVRRALRFAMACLTPTRFEFNGAGQEPAPASSHVLNGEETYDITRPYRQNLQMAAVGGLTSGSYPSTEGDETDSQGEMRHYRELHVLLARIINSRRPSSSSGELSLASDSTERADMLSTIDEGHRKVRILAARLLCNIVTDNRTAAVIVLRDLPLSPAPDLVESRIAGLIIRSRLNNEIPETNHMIFWSDLISSTAQVHGTDPSRRDGKLSYDNQSGDREALAAVAAALHNLLTSLEGRTSSERNTGKDNDEQQLMRPSCSGFEMAADTILLNSLLRNMLPTKAVIMQSQVEREEAKPARPKFTPPVSAEEILSDSATEWISYILERLASRGLFLNMLHSIGGTKSNSVTPEEVVLVSCIRQAVDNYHTLASTSETKKVVRRRSSTGIKMPMSVHPLWGRADDVADGKSSQSSHPRIAVPVLLSLANEIERFRLKLNILRENQSLAMYDGEENCTTNIIDDLCDILAQSLGEHISPSPLGTNNPTSNEDFIADARSIIGRETSLIPSCCTELGRILDIALAHNAGKKAREMHLSSQEQRTAIMIVRLVANIIYHCRYNQDLLRITPAPVLKMDNTKSASSDVDGKLGERTGLHVLLSTTTLSPACFTLREWCIVAIRNAVEGNPANTEIIRSLEANEALTDTPELQRMGIKIDIDAKGKVNMTRGSQSSYPSDSDHVSWA